MKGELFACFWLLVIINRAQSANILYINAVPSPSHHIFNYALVLGLADKGHNVTFLSSDLVGRKTSNVHHIQLEKVYDGFDGGSLPILELADKTPMAAIMDTLPVMELSCDGALQSKGLDELLAYPKDFRFDLVIYDFSCSHCLLPLVARFKYPPLVSVSAFANPPFTTEYVGGHKQLSYVPHYELNYPNEMNFVQRISNIIISFMDWW